MERCHDCGVLPGRDHHFDCQSPDAKRIRRKWEREDGIGRLAEQTCRVCGCNNDDCRGCWERTGYPCFWVEEDLCSACAGIEATGFLVRWPCGGCGNVLKAVLGLQPERLAGVSQCGDCHKVSEAGLVLETFWNGAQGHEGSGGLDINIVAATVARMLESVPDWLLFDPLPLVDEAEPVNDLEAALAAADIVVYQPPHPGSPEPKQNPQPGPKPAGRNKRPGQGECNR